MLEAFESGRKVEKSEYKRRVPPLRVELQRLQYELRGADFPVIVLLAGDDTPGVNETMHVLNGWMDPRSVQTHAFGPPSDEERDRPEFWRYWRVLPAKGAIGVFLGGWTMRAVVDRLDRRIKRRRFDRRLEHVRRFEKMLTDDGAVLLKFWLHLSKAEVRKRRKNAQKKPKKAWRLHEHDPWIHDDYNRGMKWIKAALRKTSTDEAPWQVVESSDEHYRDLTVAETLRDGVARRLSDGEAPPPSRPVQIPEKMKTRSRVLSEVDLSRKLEREDYSRQLDRYQAELHHLTHRARDKGVSSVLVFEGWDAAGKGGVIRRLSAALDPPSYRVIPIAAPNPGELAHHYLWRFWLRLPRAGTVTIFDRSWYGRVLVERVEALATKDEWRRAYDEINEFESLVCEHGVLLLKFWLHIDKDEQLRRFRDRKKTPFKKYKITPEDYRNRRRWADYGAAVDDMVARTSTGAAPWELVAANDKRWARIRVLKTFCRRLAERV